MADQEQRAVVIRQHLLEEVERVDVEIVGRLVQDQKIGALRQRLGQKQPIALAAGEGRHFGPELPVLEEKVLQV